MGLHLLTREDFDRNGYIVGLPGSGKTSLLVSLLGQFSQLRWNPITGAMSQPSDTAIVVLDGKGESYFREMAKIYAGKTGRTFYPWSIENPECSMYFTAKNLRTGNVPWILFALQMADALLLMQGGDVYGPRHFSSLLFAHLLRNIWPDAVDHFNDNDLIHKVRSAMEFFRNQEYASSFREIYNNILTNKGKSGRLREQAKQVELTLEQLLSFPHFMSMEHVAHAPELYWPDFLDGGGIAYFDLKSIPAVSGTMSKIILTSLFNTLVARKNQGRRNPRVFILFDEFGMCTGSMALDLILMQGRSYGMSIILSHQSYDSLSIFRHDLRPVIWDTTGIKCFLTIGNDLADEIISSAGDEISQMYSYDTTGALTTVGEVMKKKITRAELYQASLDQHSFVFQLEQNSKLTNYDRPQIARWSHPIPESLYKSIEHAPWKPIPQSLWVHPQPLALPAPSNSLSLLPTRSQQIHLLRPTW